MPTILGANSDTGAYEIANSIYINRSAGGRLAHTFSGGQTDRQKNTVSFWIKRCRLTTGSTTGHQVIFSNQDNDQIGFDGATDQLRFVSAGTMKVRTNRVFRDTSAWYHIVFAMDTTQGTGSNRIKFYVNGVQETSFETYTDVNQNTNHSFFIQQDHDIGRSHSDANRHYDGYLAEMHGIDGQQLDPSYFGETNSNGVWVPKKYTGTYGNNGFFLEFKQTGTSADASGKGADTSGNGHHFNDSSIEVEEIKTDTPTNNFCTLNNLTKRPIANGTIREGNLQYEASTADSSVYGTIGIPPGMKVYFEVKLVSNTAQNAIGIHNLYDGGDGAFVKGGSETGTWSFKPRGAASVAQYFNNGSITNTGVNNYANDTIVGVAVDNANGHIHYHINGTYLNSSDPTDNNPTALVTGHDETIEQYLHFSLDTTTTQPKNQYNFGNPVHSISSANADANGYGSFEYAVPSGYYALCTKNLAEFG